MVEGTEAGFDVGDRDGGGEGGDGGAIGARRIALHHQQARPVGKQGRDRPCNCLGVAVGIALARTMQTDDVMGIEPMIGGVQSVLARQDDPQALAGRGQRGRDGCQFDRFRTSSDNDVDAKAAQLSP